MAEQDKRIEELTAQLKKQTGQIQKVSAQMEVTKAAPQTVRLPAIALREGGNEQ